MSWFAEQFLVLYISSGHATLHALHTLSAYSVHGEAWNSSWLQGILQLEQTEGWVEVQLKV